MKRIREKIDATQEEILELWNGVYHPNDEYEFKGQTYIHMKTASASDYPDGDSWDFIIKRKSDGKYFKFNVWNAGEHNGYVVEDEYLIEVFEKQTITYE